MDEPEITKKNPALQNPQSSEKKYRQLFETMSKGFLLFEIIYDNSGKPMSLRYLDANFAHEKLTGLNREQVVGKDLREVLPEIEDYWVDSLIKVSQTGEPQHLKQYNKDLDGWFDVYAYRPQKGKAAVIFTNITESKKIADDLKQSETDLKQAQQVANIGSWRLDVQKNELTWSDENHHIFGISKGTPMNYETFLSTVHPDDRQYVEQKWTDAMKGEPYDIKHRIIVDGKTKWVREKAFMEFDHKDELKAGFGITQEITKQKEAEEALKEINKTLEKRVQERTAELELNLRKLEDAQISLLQAHRIAKLGNWRWDLVNDTFECSRQVYSIMGIDPENYVPGYEKFLEFVHPDDRDTVKKAVDDALKSMDSSAVEHRLIRTDGREVIVQDRAEIIRNAEGKPTKMIGTIQDVTKDRQKEEQLSKKDWEIKARSELIDLAHDMIIVHDLDGRIIFWNKGAENTYGYKRDEVLGEITHEILNTKYSEPLIKIVSSVTTKGLWEGEMVHTAKDGRQITVESRWSLQQDQDGNPKAILEIDRDITVRKAAQVETEDARKYAESIIETVEEALLVLDSKLHVVSANKTFYEIFQMKPDKVIGKYVYELDEGHWHSPEFIKLLEGVLPENKSINDYEIEYKGKKGTINLLLNARRLSKYRKDEKNILLAFHDITTHKLQENALKELTEELLMAEEQQRQQVATALHDSVGQLLSFSKRELSSLLKEPAERTDERLKKVWESLSKSIKQSRKLTADLSSPTLHSFGLEAAIEELAEEIAKENGFELEFNASGEEKPLEKKVELLLYRSVKELLWNIVKHSKAENVTVGMKTENGFLEITVADDGKGFNTARLNNNGKNNKKKSFGLFSIEQRLTNVGGSFNIESEKKKGTKVIIKAPLSSTVKKEGK